MVDWAQGALAKNHAIRRGVGLRQIVELLLTSLSIGLVAAALLFHSWVRVRIVDIGYEQQKLLAEEEALLKTQQSLSLEEQTLKSPERIDAIARNELGMQLLRADQLLAPAVGAGSGEASVLAMANVDGGPAASRKAASVY